MLYKEARDAIMTLNITGIKQSISKGKKFDVSSVYTPGTANLNKNIIDKISDGSIGRCFDQHYAKNNPAYNKGKGSDILIHDIHMENKSRYLHANTSTPVSIAKQSLHSIIVSDWASQADIVSKLQYINMTLYDLCYKSSTNNDNEIIEDNDKQDKILEFDVNCKVVDNNNVFIHDNVIYNLTDCEIQDELKDCFNFAVQELNVFYYELMSTKSKSKILEYVDADTTTGKKWKKFGNTSKLYFEINKENLDSVSIRMTYNYLCSLQKLEKNKRNLKNLKRVFEFK